MSKSGLLLSGGMDSLALAWWKRPQVAFTVNYGQRAAQAEQDASAAICLRLGIEHHILTVDCSSLGSGDMALAEAHEIAPNSDWWPYRNQLLVTLVLMKAVAIGVTELWIGTVNSDGSHLDGTQEFVSRVNALVQYQEGGISVAAPAIELSTAELIKTSGVPPEVLAWAHSCHKANLPCCQCRGCNKYFATYNDLTNELG